MDAETERERRLRARAEERVNRGVDVLGGPPSGLFGPAATSPVGGAMPANPFEAMSGGGGAQGKNKRDLMWEEKRKRHQAKQAGVEANPMLDLIRGAAGDGGSSDTGAPPTNPFLLRTDPGPIRSDPPGSRGASTPRGDLFGPPPMTATQPMAPRSAKSRRDEIHERKRQEFLAAQQGGGADFAPESRPRSEQMRTSQTMEQSMGRTRAQSAGPPKTTFAEPELPPAVQAPPPPPPLSMTVDHRTGFEPNHMLDRTAFTAQQQAMHPPPQAADTSSGPSFFDKIGGQQTKPKFTHDVPPPPAPAPAQRGRRDAPPSPTGGGMFDKLGEHEGRQRVQMPAQQQQQQQPPPPPASQPPKFGRRSSFSGDSGGGGGLFDRMGEREKPNFYNRGPGLEQTMPVRASPRGPPPAAVQPPPAAGQAKRATWDDGSGGGGGGGGGGLFGKLGENDKPVGANAFYSRGGSAPQQPHGGQTMPVPAQAQQGRSSIRRSRSRDDLGGYDASGGGGLFGRLGERDKPTGANAFYSKQGAGQPQAVGYQQQQAPPPPSSDFLGHTYPPPGGVPPHMAAAPPQSYYQQPPPPPNPQASYPPAPDPYGGYRAPPPQPTMPTAQPPADPFGGSGGGGRFTQNFGDPSRERTEADKKRRYAEELQRQMEQKKASDAAAKERIKRQEAIDEARAAGQLPFPSSDPQPPKFQQQPPPQPSSFQPTDPYGGGAPQAPMRSSSQTSPRGTNFAQPPPPAVSQPQGPVFGGGLASIAGTDMDAKMAQRKKREEQARALEAQVREKEEQKRREAEKKKLEEEKERREFDEYLKQQQLEAQNQNAGGATAATASDAPPPPPPLPPNPFGASDAPVLSLEERKAAKRQQMFNVADDNSSTQAAPAAESGSGRRRGNPPVVVVASSGRAGGTTTTYPPENQQAPPPAPAPAPAGGWNEPQPPPQPQPPFRSPYENGDQMSPAAGGVGPQSAVPPYYYPPPMPPGYPPQAMMWPPMYAHPALAAIPPTMGLSDLAVAAKVMEVKEAVSEIVALKQALTQEHEMMKQKLVAQEELVQTLQRQLGNTGSGTSPASNPFDPPSGAPPPPPFAAAAADNEQKVESLEERRQKRKAALWGGGGGGSDGAPESTTNAESNKPDPFPPAAGNDLLQPPVSLSLHESLQSSTTLLFPDGGVPPSSTSEPEQKSSRKAKTPKSFNVSFSNGPHGGGVGASIALKSLAGQTAFLFPDADNPPPPDSVRSRSSRRSAGGVGESISLSPPPRPRTHQERKAGLGVAVPSRDGRISTASGGVLASSRYSHTTPEPRDETSPSEPTPTPPIIDDQLTTPRMLEIPRPSKPSTAVVTVHSRVGTAHRVVLPSESSETPPPIRGLSTANRGRALSFKDNVGLSNLDLHSSGASGGSASAVNIGSGDDLPALEKGLTSPSLSHLRESVSLSPPRSRPNSRGLPARTPLPEIDETVIGGNGWTPVDVPKLALSTNASRGGGGLSTAARYSGVVDHEEEDEVEHKAPSEDSAQSESSGVGEELADAIGAATSTRLSQLEGLEKIIQQNPENFKQAVQDYFAQTENQTARVRAATARKDRPRTAKIGGLRTPHSAPEEAEGQRPGLNEQDSDSPQKGSPDREVPLAVTESIPAASNFVNMPSSPQLTPHR